MFKHIYFSEAIVKVLFKKKPMEIVSFKTLKLWKVFVGEQEFPRNSPELWKHITTDIIFKLIFILSYWTNAFCVFSPAEECGTLSAKHEGSSQIGHIQIGALSTPALDKWHFLVEQRALWFAVGTA